ncbi:hypothetical protein BBL07_15910 [Agrobacterium vitis]|nr:hypothetical protein BBL07_15910 [Agrobacterium vitis]
MVTAGCRPAARSRRGWKKGEFVEERRTDTFCVMEQLLMDGVGKSLCRKASTRWIDDLGRLIGCRKPDGDRKGSPPSPRHEARDSMFFLGGTGSRDGLLRQTGYAALRCSSVTLNADRRLFGGTTRMMVN